ncbi:MAG: hypothetical protein OEL57_08915 [Trichlorobacter sp.]|uniref:hypothetical protein n=1 Tax=Trichlorobacter sp. TaxID=2911007 RepID=UPI00255EE6BA|nr:hypothetical protein [Trichlorobacter sp.]MDK9718015.1 hypothetical protein [Trichlorobacter sp.]
MKTGVSLLLALFAVICFPLLALAIDPGTANGSLTVGATVVNLTHSYAHLHDNAEDGPNSKKEMRILVADRAVQQEAIAGLNPFFTLSAMVRKGTVRGVLVRFDPAKPKEVVVTVLFPQQEERYSLGNKTISQSERSPLDKLVITNLRVSAAMEQSSEGNPVQGWPAEKYAFSFNAPLFREPAVTAILKGKQALNSPQVKAVLAKTAAMAKGDYAAVKSVCTERSIEEMDGFMAQGKDESLKMMAEAGKQMGQAVKKSPLTLVVRGDRATLLIKQQDGRSMIGLVKRSGVWLVD